MPATSASIRRARALLGTFVEIDVTDAHGCDAEGAVEAAFSAVADVHRLMSFHDADSDVSRLNLEASGCAVKVHPWTFAVLKTALDMAHRSDGAFDIGVAGAPPQAGTSTLAAIELLADDHVRFGHPTVKIDLGGIAKGFAVDRALEALRMRGVRSAMVNAGGDLAAFGPDVRVVHIRDPQFPDRLLCQIEVSNEALASSARRFDPFRSADTTDTAVLEPATRRPAHGVYGATVRAPTCMVADALTKVVMIAGERAAAPLAHFKASAMLIATNGDIQTTSNWQGVLQHAA
ncbi:putative thiamine biosynthesis HESIS lipoprotein APBE transmenbrane [Bradyrhizobium oligotrophicum S58]|uniref:FAD:protein FMN transferase n=1 Tax=Bradyrhizobium oligotrophicum S58 TaxID=1245469 RepID=M4ZN29_9BRAD|nr:FAD:protein FMN transferase [Bradyrhizobium oligotrophicum]BAM87600.1 putative thiamine biosynthesis HESIS lipoprotein APBE transmenbrane [Bradyrhizobium oligotrophicum S58]